VNELDEAARMRTGRVSMNESGCPCADHATACADRNRGRKIRADIGVCSQQLWLRPQVLGDVLDDVLDGRDFTSAILSRRVTALIDDGAQFIRPETSRI
jgi:hypothetical protein